MTYRPQLYNILADVFVICQAAGILGILAKIYIRRYITYLYVRMINIVVYIQQRERERERERESTILGQNKYRYTYMHRYKQPRVNMPNNSRIAYI